MISVEDYAAKQLIGSLFILTKENLGIADDEEFHRAVAPYVERGGGDNFKIDEAKRESRSGKRMYFFVSCTRTMSPTPQEVAAAHRSPAEPSRRPSREEVLRSLHNLLARAYGVLRGTDRPDHYDAWIADVRSKVALLYGDTAPELDYFPRFSKRFRERGPGLGKIFEERVELLAQILKTEDHMLAQAATASSLATGNRVFIGHGHSPLWRELKDFLADRLHVHWDEFNREPTAGVATSQRLESMLNEAAFAFLVMTGDDERGAERHARPNVIHEAGLFQGRLGFRRAIILLEDGCTDFSNIDGLTVIPFQRNDIKSSFEEVRRVLERERIIGTS